MTTTLNLHVEAREVGGVLPVANLDRILRSWTADDLLNNVGEFTGELDSSADCDATLAQLEPWFVEIHVFDDDGNTMWCGPLTYAPSKLNQTSGQIKASTMLWWTQNRSARYALDYSVTRITSAAFVRQVFYSGLVIHDPNLVAHMTVWPGGTETRRDALIEHADTAWDTVSDLFGTEVDVWCRGRAIHIAPVGTLSGTLGSIGATQLFGGWRLVRDGRRTATSSIVVGRSDPTDPLLPRVIAIAGGPTWATDETHAVLVEKVHKDERINSETAAEWAAAGRVSPLAPVVFETMESGSLDCSAGIDPADLAVAAGITIEIDGATPIDARIKGLHWASDGNQCTVGVTISDRGDPSS